MKKVFAIFAIASMFAVASCGNKEVKEEGTETIEVVEETVVEEEVIIIDEADSTVVVEEVVEVVESVN
ncbi:hypothetical protein [Algoriphagus chordae]|uniref:Lipoprotein n=1 Tax=Algoriphagus chordae TaxID=237019 RepID=A0A2W7RP48_9BACT|nr:hypothetical protein [Algoriphagus chordae]PZX52535.1 hypothetical protein LV85_01837 [Algoriphagus chordae]